MFSQKKCNQFYLGRDRGHYYVDYPDRSLRLIFLDSYDPAEKERYGFTKSCARWLALTLLLTPSRYRVILFSHVPPLAKIHIWSDTIRNEERITGIVKRHNRRYGNILAWLCGHTHSDFIYKEENISIVSIGCSKWEECTYKKPALYTTEHRHADDRTRDLWDIMTVRDNGDIILTRFGAGKDRMIIHHD